MSDDSTPKGKTGRNPTRDGNGRFDRDLATAERDAEIARLRTRGRSYPQIARELGISQSTAYEAVQRVLKATVQEAGEEVIALEAAKLDAAEQIVWAVLEAKHVTVQHGRLVLGLDDLPLEDHGPVLAAIDRLVKVSESRRKLLGRDAAQKLDLSGELSYQVVGVDPEALT